MPVVHEVNYFFTIIKLCGHLKLQQTANCMPHQVNNKELMHEQYKEMKCGRDSARTLWIHLFITDMNSICSILTHFTEFKGL